MALLPDITDLGRRPVPQSRREPVTVRNAGAVGDAVAEVGRGMGEAATALHQLDQRRQGAQAGVDFANMTAGVTQYVNDQREHAQPGGAGHTAAVQTRVQGDIDNFLHTIRDPEVRARYEGLAAQYRGQLLGEEDAWEIGRRRDHSVANINEMSGNSETQILTNPDEATYSALDRNLIDSIANGGLDADTAAQLQRRNRAALAGAYLQGKIERDPNVAREILRSGVLNEQLSGNPELIVRLTDAADSEIRVREADQRRAAAASQEQVRQRNQMLDRRFEQNDPTLTDADLEAAQRENVAAGMSADAFDIGVYRIRLDVQKHYRTAGPLELRRDITTLDERIARAGDRASPDDVVRRAEMQRQLTARSQIVQQAPLAALAQTGATVEPVNFANRGSVRARIADAAAAEQQYGNYQFFFEEEARTLQNTLASGPAGRLQVANQLAIVASVDAQAADRAATQIAPNDRVLRRAIRLGPVYRQAVLEGAAALPQMNQRITNSDGSNTSFESRSADWFRVNIAPQLSRMPPEQVADVLETARAYYAEVNRRAGTSARTDFDQGNFATAVSVALGANGGRGGTAYWSSGPRSPNGSAYGFVLPTNMNRARFERVMTWLPLARLGEHWPDGAVNGQPMWNNNSPMGANDLRTRFVPIMVDDGVYEFHAPNGGVALTPTGAPFQLSVYALEAHPPARASQRPATPPPPPAPAPAPRMRSAYEAAPQRETYRRGVDAPTWGAPAPPPPRR